MRKIYFTCLSTLLLLSFSFPGNDWKKELASMSKEVKKEVTMELTPEYTIPNMKVKLKDKSFKPDLLQSIFMCDFLAEIGGTESFAHYKFPYDDKGGMAYVMQHRLLDAKGGIIDRYLLITINSKKEWVDQKVLAQGGSFFFRNSDMGSCTQAEGSNAIYVEYKGNFKIKTDKTISSSYSIKQSDVNIETGKNKIINIVTEGEWGDPAANTYFIDEEGMIQVKE